MGTTILYLNRSSRVDDFFFFAATVALVLVLLASVCVLVISLRQIFTMVNPSGIFGMALFFILSALLLVVYALRAATLEASAARGVSEGLSRATPWRAVSFRLCLLALLTLPASGLLLYSSVLNESPQNIELGDGVIRFNYRLPWRNFSAKCADITALKLRQHSYLYRGVLPVSFYELDINIRGQLLRLQAEHTQEAQSNLKAIFEHVKRCQPAAAVVPCVQAESAMQNGNESSLKQNRDEALRIARVALNKAV